MIQSRTARAIGASAVRGRGRKGTIAASRQFVRGLDLSQFGTRDAAKFKRALDQSTNRLLSKLPRTAQQWGVARKVLNIFLMNSFYTTFLNERFKLHRAEHPLEIPLDSYTATAIRKRAEPNALPPWRGVKRLTPELSCDYQRVALEAAKEEGFARVHLDALWWSVERDEVASA